MGKFKQLQKQLENIHEKTGYEDLEHGVLALQIAEHAVEEALETRVLGERFSTSETSKRIGRQNNGTRS